MDQQEKTPQENSRESATMQPKQPPSPEQPLTDERNTGSKYRAVWQAYSDAWYAYYEARGELQGAEQVESLENSRDAWRTHWKKLGQLWRTEPDINEERQVFLANRRDIPPDIQQGNYPFKGIKLSRADVEWLLATHENGRGPVDWSDERQRVRNGLDLRGADLRFVDLQDLPLACLQGSLKWNAQPNITQEQRAQALVHLEGANLRRTHLEGAILAAVHLENGDLTGVHLEHAYLLRIHLEEASLWGGHIERANLIGAFLEGALLGSVVLADANHVGPVAVDTKWNDTNLAIVDWSQLHELGDEYKVRKLMRAAQVKDRREWLWQYDRAVRANRQLAVALQSQGLNEDADRFAYRAHLLQRVVLRRQRKWLKYLASGFFWLIAGYGYRPLRTFLLYLCMIAGFAAGYFAVTHTLHTQTYPLAWYEALVLSVSSFHGRGFFQPVQSLGDPVAILASIEAVFGLLIEISFIATFTQRYFGK